MTIPFNLSKISQSLIYIAIGCTFLAQSYDLGPISLKVYPVVILFLFLSTMSLKNKEFLFSFKGGVFLFSLWGVFLFWKLISSYLNGSNMIVFTREFLSADIVSIIMFISVVYFFKTDEKLRGIVFFILTLIMISIVVGLFQWFDYRWAWDLNKQLNPYQDLEYETISSKNLIIGLAPYVFTFGYHLVGATLFLLPYLFMSRKKFFYGCIFLVVVCALIILQQRGAVVAAVLGSIFFLYSFRKKLMKNIFVFLIILGLFFVFLVFLFQSGFFEMGRYGIYRLDQLRDDSRLELIKQSLGYLNQSFLWGIPKTQFIQESYINVAPHNLFLNVYVFYGFIGFILCVVMVIFLIKLVMRVMKVALFRNDPFGVGIGLVILGQLINSQFHNESIITSSFFTWWFIAFAVIYQRLYPFKFVRKLR